MEVEKEIVGNIGSDLIQKRLFSFCKKKLQREIFLLKNSFLQSYFQILLLNLLTLYRLDL